MFLRVVVLFAVGLSFGASANDTLRGAGEVRLSLSLEENKATGLSEASLETQVKREIQKLGIPISTGQSAGHFHLSILILSINLAGSTEPMAYVYSISADFYQKTKIEREDIIITSTSSTWSHAGRLGLADDSVKEMVTEVCMEIVRSFANDYLQANQKTSKATEAK